MPCDAIGLRSARLAALSNAEALMQSPEALAVCRKLLAGVWSTDEAKIGVKKSDGDVVLNFGSWYVRVPPNGNVLVYPDTYASQVKSILDSAVKIALQLKVQKAVAARYQIVEQQRARNGALVISVDL